MNKERILGVAVSDLGYADLESNISDDIRAKKKSFVVAINPEKILKARKDKELLSLLDCADYPIPDGIGVVLASRLKKGNIKNRVTGIECMDMLCALSERKGYKLFLYGANEEAVSGAKAALEQKYPNINIVGYINGYEQNNDKIIKVINESGADIVFVALGSPKQEYWIRDNIAKLGCKIFMGVGGSFDVLSGAIKRAPEKMQKLGLEWFYRLIKEPKRIFRQIKLIKFVALVLFDK